MRLLSVNLTNPSHPRRGAMLVAVLALIVLILIMVTFSVDVAFMQLARTELRAATDAAAKAGAAALSRTDGDANTARAEAKRIAKLNMVAGKPLVLVNSNIEVGNSTMNLDGSWSFKKNVTPFTSVRVTGDKRAGSSSGPVNLFFGNVLGVKTFTPLEVATASSFSQDIVLALDRSGSMCWDLTGVDGKFPPEVAKKKNPSSTPPDPVASRWAALDAAVDIFLSELQVAPVPPNVGLVTWASDLPASSYPGITFNAADLDIPLGSDFDGIADAINKRGSQPMMGFTHMSAGMDLALQTLTGPGARQTATKTMVLMTDGIWNRGRNPIDAARDAAKQKVVIHTITFLPGTDQSEMQEVANITGGRHFHATNKQDLVSIFHELAMTLPVSLTE